ncbi:MAG: hypothetical protein IKB98_06795, partial [Clostridia bacterium]|nr:hypothetical protein [Clostridia bacterium]
MNKDSDFFPDAIGTIAGTGNGSCCNKKEPSFDGSSLFGCSNYLSSRTVSSQVLSALVSLTSV